MLLIATSFALIGCGEFDKIFVMDNGKSTEENKLSSSELSSLQLEDDTESVVISNLNTLKDSDFDIEKDQKSIGTTLSYISRVLKRSELLPKEKHSQCSCSYAASTHELATEALGTILVKVYAQGIMAKSSDDPKTYKELYGQFKTHKEILTDLSKIDAVELSSTSDEKVTLSSLQKKAQTYLTQLTPAPKEEKKE